MRSNRALRDGPDPGCNQHPSTRHVTPDSCPDALSNAHGRLSGTAIYGHGHTVHDDATLAANSWLGGMTYDLNGGGYLIPK